jgi:hypothetical protein
VTYAESFPGFLPGFPPFVIADATVVITVSGYDAAVSGLCYGCTVCAPPVEATGHGSSLAWSGSSPCPDIAFGGTGVFTCGTVTVELQGASLRLQPDGTMEGSISGTASGCGQTSPLVVSLQGTR